MSHSNPPPLYQKAILEKIEAFCAYQERSIAEVRRKLQTLEIPPAEMPVYIELLQQNNFLNEARFVSGFVRGKFRSKHWGRIRLRQELRAKGIAADQIQSALESELDEEEYLEALRTLVQKRAAAVREANPFKRKQKIAQYVLARGYESELVWAALGESDLG